MKINRETFRDIRDTIGWGTVLIWAGISIHDMKFKQPKVDNNPPPVVKEVDLNDGRVFSRDDFVPSGFTREKWEVLNGRK